MVKKVDEKEIKEVPPEGKPDPEVKEKVEAKLEKAEAKLEKVTGEKENIVNYVPKPRVDDPEFDFKSWAKALDSKLDTLLQNHKPTSESTKTESKGDKSPTEEPSKGTSPPKKSWLDGYWDWTVL